MQDATAANARHEEAARRIVDALGLDRAPVALGFVDEPPAGVDRFAGAVPAACAFWREAERQVFFADADQHANCPIGAHVMGFPSDEARQADLQAVVERMLTCGYLDPEEPGRIPTVGRAAAGIVYGPLASFPVAADLVVLWLRPTQAMLLQEAVGKARWADGGGYGLLGRPGCAALPIALGDQVVSLSAGCTGMRTFTEVSGELLLAAVPGDDLDELAGRLEQAVEANRAMQDFYDERRAALGARGA